MIPAYTLELQVSWLFVYLVFLELILPGVTLTTVEKFLVVSEKCLSRPFIFTGVGNV
ncbi:MAG: hypothetical protein F6K22_24290 [Okeania sp. SIO2F4]|uniref:hypothetical protein n=1 Tax=Okeania sp. SIO2F4 TaxID=2607790 RepID=UPI00142A2A68|nr:hypothetical protein [Okeania sp. SIO2F4]NES05652.1 hypothetical protein [Okeania sp. SIO2F4]